MAGLMLLVAPLLVAGSSAADAVHQVVLPCGGAKNAANCDIEATMQQELLHSYASDGIVALLQVRRNILAGRSLAKMEPVEDQDMEADATSFLAPRRAAIRHPWQKQKQAAEGASLLGEAGLSSVLTEDDKALAAEITGLHEELEQLWRNSSMSAGAEQQTEAWMSLVTTKAKLDVAYGKTRTRYEEIYRQIVQLQEQLEKLEPARETDQRRLQTEISGLQARSKALSKIVTGGQDEKAEGAEQAPVAVAVGGVIAEAKGAPDAKEETQMADTLIEKHLKLEELWGKLVEAGRKGGGPESSSAAQAERWTSLVEAKLSLDAANEAARTRYEELYREIIRLREKRKRTDDLETKQKTQEEIDILKRRASALERLANTGAEKTI